MLVCLLRTAEKELIHDDGDGVDCGGGGVMGVVSSQGGLIDEAGPLRAYTFGKSV
jgi:hypothetical protein